MSDWGRLDPIALDRWLTTPPEDEEPEKPEIKCDTCGAPVNRSDDDAMKGTEYWRTPGGFIKIAYVFYHCPNGGKSMPEAPYGHLYGKTRALSRAATWDELPDYAQAEHALQGLWGLLRPIGE